MSVNEMISRRLRLLPKGMQDEVLVFVEYLLYKKNHKATSVATKRQAGLATGLIQMEENFDEPLNDFKGYM